MAAFFYIPVDNNITTKHYHNSDIDLLTYYIRHTNFFHDNLIFLVMSDLTRIITLTIQCVFQFCYFFSLVKQKQLLGPGTYNINDFIDQMAKKPGSTRGVCETREARFDTTKMVCSKIMLPSSTHGQLHVHVSSITISIQDNWQRSALEKNKTKILPYNLACYSVQL